ncbi:unnamed protein product [Pieris macdunnoughi]|nr:unnamed protein product [Pieris macdunnoughi]
MQSPNGETSAFYYKSKLNSYNFTITELSKIHEENESTMDISKSYENVHCYFWDETQAKRGGTEIGSCVSNYLQMVCEEAGEREVNITFISDNCCGQNKNLTCLYLYANINNLSSITHKYQIKGEADNVHSLIQKQITRDLKTGPIYSPVQYMSAIKRARKTGTPFKVHSLTHSFLMNFRNCKKNGAIILISMKRKIM